MKLYFCFKRIKMIGNFETVISQMMHTCYIKLQDISDIVLPKMLFSESVFSMRRIKITLCVTQYYTGKECKKCCKVD